VLMRYLLLLIVLLQLTGCAGSLDRSEMWKEQSLGLASEIMQGVRFHHRIFYKADRVAANKCLRIYIEGDGTPWESRHRVATDPSPQNAVLLNIMKHDTGAAVYLGRPCYFGLIAADQCKQEDWTYGRFSSEIVESMLRASRRLKQQYGAEKLAFIGHSGGGVLATLLVERLSDAQPLVTLAAPLDLEAWTQHHAYTPLYLSLNPADIMPSHHDIEQHWVGSEDDNVPPATQRRYLQSRPWARQVDVAGMQHDLADRSTKEWSQKIDRYLAQNGCTSKP